MRIKFIFFAFAFMVFTCKPNTLFSSRKDKNNCIQIIKKNVELTKEEFNSIKHKDTILYELGISIDKNVKQRLIKKRLDSFFNKNYTKKEFLFSLKVDRASNGWEFDFDRGKKFKKHINVKNFEDLDKKTKSFNDSISKLFGIKKLKDSI